MGPCQNNLTAYQSSAASLSLLSGCQSCGPSLGPFGNVPFLTSMATLAASLGPLEDMGLLGLDCLNSMAPVQVNILFRYSQEVSKGLPSVCTCRRVEGIFHP